MNQNNYEINSTETQKEKIRKRYKGVNPEELEVIPALPQVNLYEDTQEKRVAVYARVSTGDPRQTSSYELQRNHYVDVINRNPNWKLVEIYADEGISGTSLRHRNEFIRMIDDCRAGKIDLIITKSVSRFARNIMDSIGISRELKKLTPPVGILFEIENIFTLNNDSEVYLSVYAIFAQEESRTKSETMNTSIEMRFGRGIFLTPPLFGYVTDEDGNLVINEEEAKIVRLIFFMYLYGYTCTQIAGMLTKLRIKTKKGNDEWFAGTILKILQNERHCGDVRTRKTWTPDFLDHKSRKNKQNRKQILMKNHHEAIISRDDFLAVQRLISNAKYGNKGFLPELNVIQDGALKGFVSVNPRWAAFKAKDYHAASESVSASGRKEQTEIEVQSGEFDLRKFEVARSQFFDTVQKVCVTFSPDNIQFSAECIRKFDKTLYIEMLVNPNENLLAVRPCSKELRNAVQWAKVNGGIYYPRDISCTAYISTLYGLFGWHAQYKYRVRGIRRQKDDESLMIFNLSETEVFISQNEIISEVDNISQDVELFIGASKKDIAAYPSDWADSFGKNYYAQAKEFAFFDKEKEWKAKEESKPYTKPDLNVTSFDEIEICIREVIDDIEWEVCNDRE